jgi:hypothetical protein
MFSHLFNNNSVYYNIEANKITNILLNTVSLFVRLRQYIQVKRLLKIKMIKALFKFNFDFHTAHINLKNNNCLDIFIIKFLNT